MNSIALKLIVLTCLIFQSGCGITFKRKTTQETETPVEMMVSTKIPLKDNTDKETTETNRLFSKKDLHLITAYYSDKANAIIREDMIKHTKTSEKQANKLSVNEFIPRDVQVIPLPLQLEKSLSSLPLHLLRVQVDTRIVIMNVKSRQILDIIKI
ncbi:MAG: hypothetical protein OQK75_07510 [Gammaproteobacteria bacterium]|nr:hypothetical protein [Gammaproteobacteria bacterium]MCW8987503.1 hypothetical protein [Gammaproteobacteria bacterium]MCW9031365.1 hypothetical protein [Gammaproteobacteria bacterium]